MIKGTMIDINSSTFDKMKSDLNGTLLRTLSTMRAHGNSAATITVKLSIELEDSYAADTKIPQYEAEREIVIPTFAHKVTSVIQIKDEKADVTGGRGFELVFDDKTKRFFMVRTKDVNGQTSVFDDMEFCESVDDVGHGKEAAE